MTHQLHRRAAAVVCAVLLPVVAYAADRQDLRHSSAILNSIQTKMQAAGLQKAQATRGEDFAATMRKAMGLPEAAGLQLEKSRTDTLTGKRHFRYRQTYQGVPLWADRILVTEAIDGKVEKLHGNLVIGIAQDVTSIKPAFSDKEALKKAKGLERMQKRAHGISPSVYRNESSELVIYLDQAEKAYLAYAVRYFSDVQGGGNPSRPVYLLDAQTGEVLQHFNSLAYSEVGTGPGGNEKTGQYEYGTDFGNLDVTVSGSTCAMENTNVQTIDLDGNQNQPFEYNCYRNTYKYINGGYSPVNDAHYFGGIVFAMFNDWYGIAPVTPPLTIKVHYGTNYANAIWDGSSANFGDGDNMYYPFISLDTVAHEIGHGFTEQNSGPLHWPGTQNGAINEAFSDMVGEAAEFYSGNNDWKVGAIIPKGNGALRYMYNSSNDDKSIWHVNDYNENLDSHAAAGVFNKAFYVLATTDGWDTHKAFDVFMKANRDYWTAGTTFVQAAEGVRDAAIDYVYSVDDIAAAFLGVGIGLQRPNSPDSITKSNVNVEAGDYKGDYTISWTSVDDATNYELYEHYRKYSSSSGSWKKIYTGISLSRIFDNKIPGFYKYRVRACQIDYCGTYSDTVSISIPAPPPPISVDIVNANAAEGDFTVTWDSVGGVEYYELYESYRTDPYENVVWNRIFQGISQIRVFDNRNSGLYQYRVRACDEGVCGEFSEIAFISIQREEGGGYKCPPICGPEP